MSYTPPPPPPDEGGPGEGSGATPPGYGNPPPPGYGAGPAYGGAPKNNTKAVVSLVVGLLSPILGLCCFIFGLAGVAAVVLGRQAQTEIDRSGGAQTGAGMAKAGVILGAIGIVIGILNLAWVLYVFITGNGQFQFTNSP